MAETNETQQEKALTAIPVKSIIGFDVGDGYLDENHAKKIEKAMESMKRIMTACIRMTNERDWSNQDGTPYLEVTGAEKIGPRVGMSSEIVLAEEKKESDAKGEYITFTFIGDFRLGAVTAKGVMGICTTRDKFFGTKGGVFKELEDVPIQNIKYKAYSSCFRNGILRVMGLRSLTWEDLKEAGINIESILNKRSIDRSGGKNQTATDTTDEAGTRKTIRDMLVEIERFNNPQADPIVIAEKCKELLKRLTAYPAKEGKYKAFSGNDSVDAIRVDKLSQIRDKVKKEYENVIGNPSSPENTDETF